MELSVLMRTRGAKSQGDGSATTTRTCQSRDVNLQSESLQLFSCLLLPSRLNRRLSFFLSNITNVADFSANQAVKFKELRRSSSESSVTEIQGGEVYSPRRCVNIDSATFEVQYTDGSTEVISLVYGFSRAATGFDTA